MSIHPASNGTALAELVGGLADGRSVSPALRGHLGTSGRGSDFNSFIESRGHDFNSFITPSR